MQGAIVSDEQDALGLHGVFDTLNDDVGRVGALIGSVRSVELHAAAEAFVGNVITIRDLLGLPDYLLMHAAWAKLHLALSAQALVDTRTSHEYSRSETARQKMHERNDELFDEAAKDEATVESVVRNAGSVLAHLEAEPRVRTSCHALLSSSAALAWAVHESLAKDVWVAALNARPTLISEKVFRSAPSDPSGELLNRTVAVGLLAKYGFDLTRSMGSLLAPKYDFTSASGIGRAYRDAFGEAPILTHLTRPELVTLEATRHLIVHRAGIVDDEYRRRTNSERPLGCLLDLNLPTVAPWLKAVFETGIAVVSFVDGWLTRDGQRENDANHVDETDGRQT
jgi:hypothetical protein